jgi:hypothetical protein
MTTDPYFVLSDKLSEMQLELSRREWPEDRWERIGLADKFRQELWAAILAYRDSYMEKPL